MPSDPAPLDIAAIRARAEAATPGPWKTSGHSDVWAISGEFPQGNVAFVNRYANTDDMTDMARFRDAAFIAAARDDVPALCDEVERLRAEIARLRAAKEESRAIAAVLGFESGVREVDLYRKALRETLDVLREGGAPITLWAAVDAWNHHEQIPESTAPAYPLYTALVTAERMLGDAE